MQLTLKPDQKHYAPGDTATILVESPFTGTALVTVEREKVLRSFTTRLEGNAPSIRIPLVAGDVPNVFVSVIMLRGADECPRKVKEPEYRIGYCALSVADPLSRLAVTVTPGATNYLPAQTVEVTARVADASGRAVAGAEVVLYAVDDGILHLTDYSLPDPHGCFYATRPLGVLSSVSLPNLLAEDPEELVFQNKGYLIGGGGDAGGGRERVRKRLPRLRFLERGSDDRCPRQCQRALSGTRQPDAIPHLRGGACSHQPLRQRPICFPGDQAAHHRTGAARLREHH